MGRVTKLLTSPFARPRWGAVSPFAGLRLRLLLVILLAVLPLAGLTVYAGLQQRHEAVRAAQQEALRVARLAASDQERITDGARQLLVALANTPSVREQDAGACARLVADVLRQNPLYQNIGVATTDGALFCSAVEPGAQVSVARRPAFQHALESKAFALGEYTVSQVTGKPALTFAYPVLDGTGQVRVVIGATIDLEWLRELMERAELPAGSSLSVIDKSGTVLAHYPHAPEWMGRTRPSSDMQHLLARGEGLHEGVGADGTPRLFAFTQLWCHDANVVYVCVGIPKNAVLADVNRTLARNLLALGAAALLALAVAWNGGRCFILRPVQVLLRVIRRFEAGDLQARVGAAAGAGELGRVGQALDHMAATVEARERELLRSGARAEALREIATRLNAQLELEWVLDAVCRETARALDVPAAAVSLYDADGEALQLAACLGLPEELCRRAYALPAATLAQLRQGQMVPVNNVAAQSELSHAALLGASGIRALVVAPMRHEGQLAGALIVFVRGQASCFTEDEVGFLQAIADQAASALANARLYESLQREQRLRGELLRNLTSAQEEERKRIARELHDETCQGLSALIVSLETVAMEVGSASRPLQTARAVAAGLLEDIRRLIGDLRPSLLDDLGLVPAIAWYADQRLQTRGVEVDLQCSLPEGVRLPPALETALFRIAQEAISNIARHAAASRVVVDLRVAGDRAILSIEDNGRGVEPARSWSRAALGGGLGLQGMRERVKILGGEFQLRAAPGQGVRLEVIVPFVMEEMGDAQDTVAAG